MSAKQEIIKAITKISGKYSAYEVFCDWIRCSALGISNSCTLIHDKIWKDREQAYIDTMNRYTLEERNMFCAMLVLLGDALTENLSDVLGEIYMEMGMGSKASGQFFTPFHLSYLTAKMALEESIRSFDEKTRLTLNEPSCGGGGMIIAAAKVLLDADINPQRYLRVVAQDLDWKGVYMCYLQLSLIGIYATVVQGDTLIEPYTSGYPRERVMHTPAKMGVII